MLHYHYYLSSETYRLWNESIALEKKEDRVKLKKEQLIESSQPEEMQSLKNLGVIELTVEETWVETACGDTRDDVVRLCYRFAPCFR